MWDMFNGILDQGVLRNLEVDEDFMHIDLKNQQYKKFCLLVKVSPAMARLLERAGDQAGPEFMKQLDEVVDVSGIHSAIGQWPGITWEHAFPGMWHLLGFNHPTTSELLCPVMLDWNSQSVRGAHDTDLGHCTWQSPHDNFTSTSAKPMWAHCIVWANQTHIGKLHKVHV
ncbi:hypothetical protein H4582DRAFT_2061883 [Lactarius indigo]|nr:hypothetical protein H4582DRAFT_2061883 [Lactarius indigo]